MRVDYLERDDFERVLRLMQPSNALALRIASDYGLRISDVLSMRKSDMRKDCFVLTEHKRGKRRLIELPSDVRSQLIKQAGSSAYCWPHRVDSKRHRTRQTVWRDVKQACNRLKLDGNYGTHTARKVFAVEHYHKHQSLSDLQDILKHDNISTTALYALSDIIK